MTSNGMMPGQDPYTPDELAQVESLVASAARSDPGEQVETEYEGWPNRATWNVALWLGNDEYNYRAMQSFARGSCNRVTPELARIFCRSLFGSTTPDGCKLSAVHWDDIAELINDANG